MENKKCSIGLFRDETCSQEKFINCKDFPDEDRCALNFRSGTIVSFICCEHDKRFRINYTLNQKVCADPYRIHGCQVHKSENYSFLLQNSVQRAYWNNRQATIHPFACYYRSIDKNGDNIIPLNLVTISDNLTHNTKAVYSFQEVLTSFLKKKKILNISKIIYFSDGAVSQYKNRYNLLNLLQVQYMQLLMEKVQVMA